MRPAQQRAKGCSRAEARVSRHRHGRRTGHRQRRGAGRRCSPHPQRRHARPAPSSCWRSESTWMRRGDTPRPLTVAGTPPARTRAATLRPPRTCSLATGDQRVTAAGKDAGHTVACVLPWRQRPGVGHPHRHGGGRCAVVRVWQCLCVAGVGTGRAGAQTYTCPPELEGAVAMPKPRRGVDSGAIGSHAEALPTRRYAVLKAGSGGARAPAAPAPTSAAPPAM